MQYIRFQKSLEARKIIHGLSARQLREMASGQERTTEFGSPCYVTNARSRSAQFTRNTVDKQVTEADFRTVAEVREYLKTQEVIQVDRRMCQGGPEETYHCRLFVTKPYARLALMFEKALDPPHPGTEPEFVLIDVPEWKQRAIIVAPVAGVTYVLGSDYYGEVKKGFLRMLMYRAKRRGRLGLHAGSKEVWVRSARTGRIERRGLLFFGLSGTGKTSLTCHDYDLDLDLGERVRVRQDDVVLLGYDGSCKGTESRGFYIKTERLSRETEQALYNACTAPDAVLENVWVEDDGRVDFFNSELTSNGRAIVQTNRVINFDDDIDLPMVNKIFFITRNPLMPPVAKLTPAQAAATFMLGESIKTSAADPAAKGEPVREVGTNPFIIGPLDQEGNIFYEILQQNPQIDCYVLNTGYVGRGEKAAKVTLLDTVAIIRSIARAAVQWEEDSQLGFQVPRKMGEIDIKRFNLRRYFTATELEQELATLRRERYEWIAQFPELHGEIVRAVY